MTTLTRGLWLSELTKLTTTRAARWILLAAALLSALTISGVMASGGVPQDALGTDTGLRTVLAHGGLASILPLVLGILMSAGEYQHGTAVDTFLTEPRRARVVLAKLLSGAAIGVVSGLVCATVTLTTASIWYAAKDAPLDLGSAVMRRSLIGIVVWQMLYTVIGVAVGALVRAQAAAIVAVVAWMFIAETAIAGLLVSLGRWLPATAAETLGNAPRAGSLPQVGAGFVLLAWAGLLSVAAVLATTRRDVT
jgi:ABC-2 type transport system permease protein